MEKSELPKGWEWTTIRSISKKIHYGYTAKSSMKINGIKYLRITDIQNNNVNWDTVPYCKINENEISKFLLEKGDIVFARSGATVGKSFLIKNPPKAVFASYLIRIIPYSEISNSFIHYFFHSSKYWAQIHKGKIGMAQPNFNSTKLSNVTIPLSPFDEQKRIVSKIEELFSQIDIGEKYLKETLGILHARVTKGKNDLFENNIDRFKILRLSILKQAFTGKLVPQDPNNEPASELLKRMKQR